MTTNKIQTVMTPIIAKRQPKKHACMIQETQLVANLELCK